MTGRTQIHVHIERISNARLGRSAGAALERALLERLRAAGAGRVPAIDSISAQVASAVAGAVIRGRK